MCQEKQITLFGEEAKTKVVKYKCIFCHADFVVTTLAPSIKILNVCGDCFGKLELQFATFENKTETD